MNPNAARIVELPGEESAGVAMEAHELVILQYVLPVATKQQCRLSLLKGGQSTVESATPEWKSLVSYPAGNRHNKQKLYSRLQQNPTGK